MEPSTLFPIVIIGMVTIAIAIFLILLALDKGSDEE